MKDKLITFETAKLAKEKGFNWNTYGEVYLLHNKEQDCNNRNTDTFNSELRENYISAPTQSLLQRWLREIHSKHLVIRCFENIKRNKKVTEFVVYLGTSYSMMLIPNKKKKVNKQYSEFFKTYEEALEQGLIEALKLIE